MTLPSVFSERRWRLMCAELAIAEGSCCGLSHDLYVARFSRVVDVRLAQLDEKDRHKAIEIAKTWDYVEAPPDLAGNGFGHESQLPTDARTHKQVLVIRKDLKMRQGKAVAQGAHAAMGALTARGTIVDGELRIPLDADIGPWLLNRFTKVCVHVPDEAALLDIYAQAVEANLPCSLIRDSGLTEFKGVLTYTAVAVGPGANAAVDHVTKDLPLL